MKRVFYSCLSALILCFFFGKTNAQNLPKDGLIAWFPFNGTLKDESGNGLNTFFADNNKGGISLSEVNNLTDDRNGKTKSAFYFTGAGENKAIKVKLAKSLNLRDRTVALWVNSPSKAITHYSNIFELGYNSEVKQYCSILGDEYSYVSQKRDGKISSLIAEGGFVESRSYLNDDNWHHLAIVVNSFKNSYKIYIDGKLDSDSYLPIPIINNSNPYSSNPQKPISEIPVNYLVFGNVFRNDPQCAFGGKIDDIGLWNRALSDSEILQLFDNFYTANSTPNIRTDSRIKQFGQSTIDNDNSNTSTINKLANSINNESQLNEQQTFTFQNGDKYVGDIKNGNRNGQGTYTFSNGDKYIGEWKDGNRNGQGTYTFSNGATYIGGFKDNQWNGQGTYTSINGSIQKGIYENGNLIEEKKAVVVQNNQSPTISSTIKIGNLEVAQNDLGTSNHDDAVKACDNLGNGWRLPTKEELNILYQNRNKLKGLSSGLCYWTSSEGNEKNNYWIGPFFGKGTNGGGAFVTYDFLECVRPVRTLGNANSTATKKVENQNKVVPTKTGNIKPSNNEKQQGNAQKNVKVATCRFCSKKFIWSNTSNDGVWTFQGYVIPERGSCAEPIDDYASTAQFALKNNIPGGQELVNYLVNGEKYCSKKCVRDDHYCLKKGTFE